MFTEQQLACLKAPLDRSHVASRSQSGRQLSYIEGWHAIAEANRIFGFEGWHRQTAEMRLVTEVERKVGQGTGWGVSYVCRVRITVLVDGVPVERDGFGTGHGIDRDLGLAHESAVKEAETDAMKRALMTFGNPFGLALYDKTQSNVVNTPAPEDAPISDKQRAELQKALEDNGRDVAKFCEFAKIEALPDLPVSRFEWAMSAIKKAAANASARAANAQKKAA